jgi:hypothetical protein
LDLWVWIADISKPILVTKLQSKNGFSSIILWGDLTNNLNIPNKNFCLATKKSIFAIHFGKRL